MLTEEDHILPWLLIPIALCCLQAPQNPSSASQLQGSSGWGTQASSPA